MWRRQWSWFVRVWKLNQNLSLDEMAELVRDTLDGMEAAYAKRPDREGWGSFREWAEGYAVEWLKIGPLEGGMEQENTPLIEGGGVEPSEQTELDILPSVVSKRRSK